MPTWPSSLPDWKFPLSDKSEEGVIRTGMDAGPDKVRRRYSAVPKRFQTSMVVSGLQRYVLESWFKDTLGEGALEFDRTDPINGGTQSFRFLTSPEFRLRAGDSLASHRLYEVTLSLERMPGQAVPEYTVLLEGDYANPLITFTRASKGWYFDADGLLQEAATNAMRFDYDPATGDLLGLLIEEERENIIERSEDFSHSYWTKQNTTVTPSAATAPDGTMTASRIEIAGGAFNYIRRQITGVDDTVSGSIWIKAASATERDFRFYVQPGSSINVTATGEWQRIELTEAITSAEFQIAVPSGGPAVDLYIWGAQLEVGSFTTSYIQTAGSTVTRSADVAPVTDLSWYNQSEGTWVFGGDFADPNIGMILHIDDGGFSNRLQLNSTNPFWVNGGVAVGNGSANISADDGKIAYAYKDNIDNAMCINGGPVSSGSLGDIPNNLTTLHIGQRSGIGAKHINGHIKSLHYYPDRLSNAKLKGLTS